MNSKQSDLILKCIQDMRIEGDLERKGGNSPEGFTYYKCADMLARTLKEICDAVSQDHIG